MQIKHILTLIMGVSMATALAQPKINSPLSRYGIGDKFFYQSHHLNMMGGLYGGYNDPNLVNLYNPAALGYLRTTAFDIGLSAGRSNLEVGDNTDNYTIGGLEHLTLAFPLRNPISEVLERKNTDYSWAMAFDLRNNTRVGYSTEVQDSLPDIGNVIRTYDGSGETYEFGWSNALRYKAWSVGLDIGVLFGNIRTNRTVNFPDRIDAARDIFEDNVNINAFRWNAGAQYRYHINKEEDNDARKRYLMLGLYGHSNRSMNTTGNQLYYGIRNFTGVRDTILDESDVEGEGKLPGVFGFGAVYEPDLRWQLGFNVETSDWSNYESDVFNTGDFESSYLIGVGAGFTPDKNAFGNYFKRVAYKAGIQYGRDGRIFNEASVSTLQLNLGMSMPFYFLRQISHVHLGLEYKSTVADVIKDKYFGVIFSATFNDNSWFLKRKFN